MRLIDNRTAFSNARDLLLAGESLTIRVKGQSMLPFFQSGSSVLIRPIQESDFKKGRVVLAETDKGMFVIHRIYRVEGDMITLLGDGNLKGTEQMPRNKVYGAIDCGALHLALALLWQWIRPLRRFPLAILRRVCPK